MRLAIITFLCGVTTTIAASAESPEISFRSEGGHSPYRNISVLIDANGHVTATITRQTAKQKDYSTVLNQYEIAALELAISSSDIFALKQPDAGALLPRDTGTAVVSVKTRSGQRELTYAHIPSLRPLEDFVWRIVTQADLSDASQDNDRMYELLGAIDPRHAANKVLQPYVFRDSLVTSLATQTDFQKVAWRLQALSCIMTPTEFSGLVSSQLDRSDLERWRFWLTTLSTPECYNNLQKEHLFSLFPLFTDQILKFGDTAKTVETPEGDAFYRFSKIMSACVNDTDGISVTCKPKFEFEARPELIVTTQDGDRADASDQFLVISHGSQRYRIPWGTPPVSRSPVALSKDVTYTFTLDSTGKKVLPIYEKKDFAEAKSFGLELWTPKEFLKKIGELK
jgi:hypothetical protein